MNISSELYFYISHLLNPKPESSQIPSREQKGLQRQYAELLDKYDNDTIKLLDVLTHSCQEENISILMFHTCRFPHLKKQLAFNVVGRIIHNYLFFKSTSDFVAGWYI